MISALGAMSLNWCYVFELTRAQLLKQAYQ